MPPPPNPTPTGKNSLRASVTDVEDRLDGRCEALSIEVKGLRGQLAYTTACIAKMGGGLRAARNKIAVPNPQAHRVRPGIPPSLPEVVSPVLVSSRRFRRLWWQRLNSCPVCMPLWRSVRARVTATICLPPSAMRYSQTLVRNDRQCRLAGVDAEARGGRGGWPARAAQTVVVRCCGAREGRLLARGRAASASGACAGAGQCGGGEGGGSRAARERCCAAAGGAAARSAACA